MSAGAPTKLRHAAAHYRLDPGKRLLWYGRPRQGILFRASDWLLVPFSVTWTGFAFFWELSASPTPRRLSG